MPHHHDRLDLASFVVYHSGHLEVLVRLHLDYWLWLERDYLVLDLGTGA
jgi:hypothetical protein